MTAIVGNTPGLAGLDLRRAKAASNAVHRAIEVLEQDAQGKFAQLARAAPADIMTMGLGQTVAFWFSSGKSHHQLMIQQVKAYLEEQQLITNAQQDLLNWIISTNDILIYRRATQETLAFLIWVKRFAEAKLMNHAA